MQKVSKKLKICLCSVVTIALIAVILLTVSFFTSYDMSASYLRKSTLTIIFSVCMAAGIIFSLSTIFFIPKNELSGDSPLTFPVMISSIFMSVILLIAAIIIYGVAFDLGNLSFNFRSIASNSQTLLIVCGVFTLISVIYFVLNCFMTDQDKKHSLALVGFAVPITAALYVAISYFDISVSMNAPAKIMFHYAMISFMLWFLYELRALLGKAMPRIYLALGFITVIFSAVSSLPWLVGFIAGKVGGPLNPSYIIYSLISLGVCVYTTTRLYVFVSARALLERIADQTPTDETEFEPIDEKSEESEEESEEQ